MSQANDLLNNIVDEDPSIPLVEPHIVIGRDRKIVVPDSLKRLAVQYDHNIETVTFKCVRYWDSHDMSQMQIYISCLLPDNFTPVTYTVERDSIRIDDIDPNTMYFDWTIKHDLTQMAGNIAFLVCVKKSDADGVEQNHWNSEPCKDCYISEGMECNPSAAIEPNADLIQRLLSAIDTANAISDYMTGIEGRVEAAAQTATDAEKGALEAEKQMQTLKNSYSNSLKGYASGHSICIENVSPVEHTIIGRMSTANIVPGSYGGQFDPTTYMYERNGLVFHNRQDGSIEILGTSTAQTALHIIDSDLFEFTEPTIYIGNWFPWGTHEAVDIHVINGGVRTVIAAQGEVIDLDLAKHVSIELHIGINQSFGDGFSFTPMINYGDTAADYVPPVKYAGRVEDQTHESEDNEAIRYFPDEDGVVEIKSVAPTMYLEVVDHGYPVEFELEYNRDIESLSAAINETANAIKGHASGSVVIVDDVSPLEHYVRVKVKSKNLADLSVVVTDGQNQVVNNGDGTITVNTTPTSSAVPMTTITLKTLAPDLKVGETYILSATSTGANKKIWLQEADYAWNFGTSAVITQAMLDSHVFVYASGNSTSAVISDFQIEPGTTATEYMPYVDLETVTVTRYGVDETDNPQTYMPEADGTVSGVTSLAPTMTFLTDTPGVTIDVEYNRDMNVVVNTGSVASSKIYRHDIQIFGDLAHDYLIRVTVLDNNPNSYEWYGEPGCIDAENDLRWLLENGAVFPATGHMCYHSSDDMLYVIVEDMCGESEEIYVNGFIISGGSHTNTYTELILQYDSITSITDQVTEISSGTEIGGTLPDGDEVSY